MRTSRRRLSSERDTIRRTLENCPFFASLSDEDLNAIAALSVLKSLNKGEYLFHEGGAVHGFFIMQSGAIKLHRVNWIGKEQVIHIFRAYESFAEETLLPDLGYTADACAIECSEVLMVRRAGFLALVERHPELALCLLRSMNRHLCLLVDRLDSLTLKDVKTRLAHWLLQRCPDPESSKPCRFELGTPKRVLAAELGAASETFSRAVAKFRAKKLISMDGQTVILHCPTKLAQFVGSTFRPSTTGLTLRHV
jgi:CRP/FNR family transcriptional regulator, dissimilatory nitrate respiration regulator